MSFFLSKNGEQEGKIGPVRVVGINGRGEDIREGYMRVNMLHIVCTHICKWKNETC
jgi:hypothetical protein